MKKQILVTGSSRGIGKAISDYFSKKDFEVIRISRTEGDFVGDIQNKAFRKKLIDELNPYVVVNNAAIYPDAQDLIGSLDTNLIALLDLTVGFMKKMKQGFIVNISSVSAVTNSQISINELVYSVAKKAISDFSTNLQLMNKSRVKICTIEPGMVETDFADIKNRYANNKENDLIFKTGIKPMSPDYIPEVLNWMITQPENVCISNVRIMNTRC